MTDPFTAHILGLDTAGHLALLQEQHTRLEVMGHQLAAQEQQILARDARIAELLAGAATLGRERDDLKESAIEFGAYAAWRWRRNARWAWSYRRQLLTAVDALDLAYRWLEAADRERSRARTALRRRLVATHNGHAGVALADCPVESCREGVAALTQSVPQDAKCGATAAFVPQDAPDSGKPDLEALSAKNGEGQA